MSVNRVVARMAGLIIAIICCMSMIVIAQSEPVSGYGTAAIDGALATGEWDNAATYSFDANLPEDFGGGTTPAVIHVMNDETHIYVGVAIEIGELDTGCLDLYFDNDGDGQQDSGDINLTYYTSGVLSSYYRVVETGSWDYDSESDGAGAVANDGAQTFYEFSHALEATVGEWPVAFAPGDRVGLSLSLILKPEGGDGVGTYLPLAVIIAGEVGDSAAPVDPPGDAQATPDADVSAYGIAGIDGLMSPGEWEGAVSQVFDAFWPAELGGDTIPATFYVMNDGATLYMAVNVSGDMAEGGYLDLFLHGDISGAASAGDINLTLHEDGSGGFLNEYLWNADAGDWYLDASARGTGIVTRSATNTCFEISYAMDAVGAGGLSMVPDDSIGCRLKLSVGSQVSGFLYTLHPEEGFVTLQIATLPN